MHSRDAADLYGFSARLSAARLPRLCWPQSHLAPARTGRHSHPVNRAEHWEHVYRTKEPDRVSWFQAEARLSRELIQRVAPEHHSRIIDIGAGASTLVDGLLASGYRNLTVLDVSDAALAIARARLGAGADSVAWMGADVLTAPLEPAGFDLWHDRAVFHFLTDATDRAAYVAQVQRAVRRGGHVIIATFAEDGPTRCSGLDVARYSPGALHEEFGTPFTLVDSHRELHTTPAGAQQAFTYCLCQVNWENARPTSA